MFARSIDITLDDRIDDPRMLFLQMKIVISRPGSRCGTLKLAARNDASANKLQKLRKTPVLRGLRNGQMKAEIRISGGRSLCKTGPDMAMRIQDRFDLGSRTPRRGKSGGLDFEYGSQFEQFDNGRDTLRF